MFFASVEERVKGKYVSEYKSLPAGTVVSIVPVVAELSKYFIEDLLDSEETFDDAFGESLDDYTMDCAKTMAADYADNQTMNYISQTIIKILHNAVIVYVKTFMV